MLLAFAVLVDRDGTTVEAARLAGCLDDDVYVAFCDDELFPVEQSLTQSCGFLPTQHAACLPPLDAQHDAPLDLALLVV
ncbi:hypothetical protein FACS1894170_03210 [Planctomycetales bacterium]|nr:hypothetical protein FACS1894170_03210 [Planctomycetales bacterium]